MDFLLSLSIYIIANQEYIIFIISWAQQQCNLIYYIISNIPDVTQFDIIITMYIYFFVFFNHDLTDLLRLYLWHRQQQHKIGFSNKLKFQLFSARNLKIHSFRLPINQLAFIMFAEWSRTPYTTTLYMTRRVLSMMDDISKSWCCWWRSFSSKTFPSYSRFDGHHVLSFLLMWFFLYSSIRCVRSQSACTYIWVECCRERIASRHHSIRYIS